MQKHEHKGRTWWLRGREPYTRKDGSATELLVWESLCQECLAPFTVRTPSEGAWQASSSFEAKHCSEHKLTASQSSRLGRAAAKAQRKANKQKAARNAACNAAPSVQKTACNVQHGAQRCATLNRQSGVLQHGGVPPPEEGPPVLHRCSPRRVAAGVVLEGGEAETCKEKREPSNPRFSAESPA